MYIKPLQDWAVIRKSEPQEKTAGGIIIPEVAKEKPLEGVVVAIGPGKLVPDKGKEKEKKKKFVPTVLKPGQQVVYQKYAEREVELDGRTFTLVREEDILGIVEERSLVEKKMHAVQTKKDGPVAIREEGKVPAVTASPAIEKKERPATKKTSVKAPAAKKKTATPKKTAAKTSGKTAKKAPAAKKSSPKKPARKKTTTKNAAAKKPSIGKTSPKKPAAKKKALKKTTVKKPTAKSSIKSATKTKAKTKKK
jgi:chaperonin GroES